MTKKLADVEVVDVAKDAPRSTQSVNMTWLSTIFVALFVAVPPTILAWKTNEKTEQVHVLVNSNMTAMKADLAVANQRIKDLTDILGKLQEERAEAAAREDAKKQTEPTKK